MDAQIDVMMKTMMGSLISGKKSTALMIRKLTRTRNGDAEQGVNISGLAGGADLGQLDFTNGIILEDDSRKTGTIEISWNPAVGASFTTTGMTTNADFSNVETGAFVAEDGHNFMIFCALWRKLTWVEKK